MREFLASSGRKLSPGWLLPLVLLVLPNCVLPSYEYLEKAAFDPGPEPRSSAIMCDIPKVQPEEADPCASPAEIVAGMPMAQAAVALATGQWNPLALDYSKEARDECNGGPKKVYFHQRFPDGYTVCLNCGTQIPSVYAGATEVCIAQCKDLIKNSEGPTPAAGVDAFCEANARPATNFDKTICYTDACSDAGTPRLDFVDPRRTPEPVKWVNLIGTDVQGTELRRTTDTTGGDTSDFNAGAASAQLITHGDAWVEFQAGEAGISHVLGLSSSCPDPTTCPDTDPSVGDIGFSISLNSDNNVNIVENGANTVNGPFGTYFAGERYRLNIVDNNDGTATISYSRLVGPCPDGTKCTEAPIAVSLTKPSYPLRIDASFREKDATLVNVTVVRIQ